jgi:hypothetical protein
MTVPKRDDVMPLSPEGMDSLLGKLERYKLYERKANLHGMCIKLITDSREHKDMWEDNFRTMNEDIRPHGRIFSICDGKKERILYERISKTLFLFNCDYYGKLKSMALAIAGDFLEDYQSLNSRFSVHGSCIDFRGRGVAIIAPSGMGKTTLSYGLLLDPNAKLVSDDWFYVNLSRTDAIAYASEKNSYIRDDIGKNWKIFQKLVDEAKLDNKRRAVVSIRRVLGGERTRSSTCVTNVFLLKRDKKDKNILKKLTPKEAVSFLIENDFCNPHQLVRTKRKLRLRKEFFLDFFSRTGVYLLNTTETPVQSKNRIYSLIET